MLRPSTHLWFIALMFIPTQLLVLCVCFWPFLLLPPTHVWGSWGYKTVEIGKQTTQGQTWTAIPCVRICRKMSKCCHLQNRGTHTHTHTTSEGGESVATIKKLKWKKKIHGMAVELWTPELWVEEVHLDVNLVHWVRKILKNQYYTNMGNSNASPRSMRIGR